MHNALVAAALLAALLSAGFWIAAGLPVEAPPPGAEPQPPFVTERGNRRIDLVRSLQTQLYRSQLAAGAQAATAILMVLALLLS